MLKSMLDLLREVLTECGDLCHVSTTRDFKTIARRVEHEGDGFLTITLPSFQDDFLAALEQGRFTRSLATGFSRPRQGGLPRFLGGFLELVFDSRSGELRADASIEAVQSIRQVTLLWKKLERPVSNVRQAKAFDAFISTDLAVREAAGAVPQQDYNDLTRVAGLLFSGSLEPVEEAVYYHGLIPLHGPGATADKLVGNQKWAQSEWPQRLGEVFPDWVYLSPHELAARETTISDIPRDQERPVKVVAVPKTMKTPRIIAIEPTAMQYMQQALRQVLTSSLENCSLVGRMIRFTDQTPNQVLAQVGSLDRSVSTLDLSEASDRVSMQLVRAVFKRNPWTLRGLEAVRSTRADVRGRVIDLAKYASMGSAVTFPVEAMCFLALIFLGVERYQGHRLSLTDIYRYRDQVRVYGDDLIVPIDMTETVIATLESFGLKVNARKSFYRGEFRESCGKEFFRGHDVSVVKPKWDLPASRTDRKGVAALVDTRNRFYWHGYWRVAGALDVALKRYIPLPTVWQTSEVLGRHSLLPYEVQSWHPDLQSPLVKGIVRRGTGIPEFELSGYHALLKWFSTRGCEPLAVDHLVRSGRAHSVDTKVRRLSPF